MATMNVSLPDEMKEWIEAQAANGRFANVSDYIRDVVRRDMKRSEGVARLQTEIDKGRAGAFTEYDSADELFADIKQRAAKRRKETNAA